MRSMRITPPAVGLLAAMLAFPALAADAPAGQKPPLHTAQNATPADKPTLDANGVVTEPTSAQALALYPAAALAAGAGGKAVINCLRTAHLALRSCKLVSETPAGQGFGDAALKIAALSPDNPKIDLPDAEKMPAIDIPVTFTAAPKPSILPDLSLMGHTLTTPTLVTGPTNAQIQAAYPARALADNIDGVAVIDCLVTAAGALSGCQLYGENPSGYGFGAAALDLAADFALKPRLFDGEAMGGAEVRVPVRFQAAQDPDAPLELKTLPDGPAGQAH